MSSVVQKVMFIQKMQDKQCPYNVHLCDHCCIGNMIMHSVCVVEPQVLPSI